MRWMKRLNMAMLSLVATFVGFAACAEPTATCRSDIAKQMASVAELATQRLDAEHNVTAAERETKARQWIRELSRADDESFADTIRRWWFEEEEHEEIDHDV